MGSKSKSQPKGDPALKKAGLQLKSTSQPIETAIEEATSSKKSKRKRSDESVGARIKRSKKTPQEEAEEEAAPMTPRLSRKKSVTFTPETKIEDGDSIKQLYLSWVAEQKLQDPDFQLSTSAPAFQIPEPPRVEEIVDTTLDEKERRVKRVKEKKPKARKVSDPVQVEEVVATPSDKEVGGKRNKEKKVKAVKGSKVVESTVPAPLPSRPFLNYLKQYSESKATWKFNKNHQNHIIKHVFNVDVIPSSHAHYIYEYVRGLQGGVRTRLRDAALAIKVSDIEEGVEGFPETMGQGEKRQREYEEALAEHVATMTASNASSEMGYEEGILLGLSDVAMQNRAAKRMRTEKILAELAASPDAAKALPAVTEEVQKEFPVMEGLQKVARKRKQRTIMMDIQADSSSESSDSDSSSDDDSASDKETKNDTSSSSSSSSSESGSEGKSSEDSSSSDSDSSDGDSD